MNTNTLNSSKVNEIIVNVASNIDYIEELSKQMIATSFALLLGVVLFYYTNKKTKYIESKEKTIFILKYLLFFIKNYKRNISYDFNTITHVRLEKINEYFIHINKVEGLEDNVDTLIMYYEKWINNEYLISAKENDFEKQNTLEDIKKVIKELDKIEFFLISKVKQAESQN